MFGIGGKHGGPLQILVAVGDTPDALLDLDFEVTGYPLLAHQIVLPHGQSVPRINGHLVVQVSTVLLERKRAGIHTDVARHNGEVVGLGGKGWDRGNGRACGERQIDLNRVPLRQGRLVRDLYLVRL